MATTEGRRQRAAELARLRTCYGRELGCDASFLVAGAVKEPTFRQYARVLDDFTKFTKGAGRTPACSDAELDDLLVEYLEEMFLEGLSSHSGSYLLAAVEAFNPRYGRRGGGLLPRARRALIGWQRLAPSHSRPPHAWAVVCGLAVWLAQSGLQEMGLWCIFSATLYLRPGESLAVRGCDIIPPCGPSAPRWTILVRPKELDLPTKTREFDDSVVWDVPELYWMHAWLEMWRARGSQPLWSFSYGELARQIRRASLDLGVENLQPYSMRHSGASWDVSVGRRSLAEVQKRGRWRAHRSVVRYEKAGLVGKEFMRIRPAVRDKMLWCEAHLPLAMNDPRAGPFFS